LIGVLGAGAGVLVAGAGVLGAGAGVSGAGAGAPARLPLGNDVAAGSAATIAGAEVG
jgi:hypothetical protein